jgi:hypothetical protein
MPDVPALERLTHTLDAELVVQVTRAVRSQSGDIGIQLRPAREPPCDIEEVTYFDPWSGTHLRVDRIDAWTIRLDGRVGTAVRARTPE